MLIFGGACELKGLFSCRKTLRGRFAATSCGKISLGIKTKTSTSEEISLWQVRHSKWVSSDKRDSSMCASVCNDILAMKNNPINEIVLLLSLRSIGRYYIIT